jgi:uncharacterized protein with HEPN domain
MQRDIRSFLWDVREAADAIMGFTQGRSFDDYVADLMFRSAVERQFEIIGEALSQLARIDLALAARILNFRQIVDFRNALIHGYQDIAAMAGSRYPRSDDPRCVSQSRPGIDERLRDQPR